MEAKEMNNNTIHITLTEVNFQSEVLESKKPVLVKFGASWLGTCDIMAPILEKLSIDFEGQIKIGVIDVDNNRKLVNEYGITHFPTFIFLKNGQAVDHIVGAAPITEFITILNDLL